MSIKWLKNTCNFLLYCKISTPAGSFQSPPASNGRPRGGRALQKLLDVAGDDWDPETDIHTNLMTSR